MSEIRWSSKCFHVDTWGRGMKTSMLLSITSVSPEALKITREQFVELGLRHHFVSCRFRLASQPRRKTHAFLEIDMRRKCFWSHESTHSSFIQWQNLEQYFSMKHGTCKNDQSFLKLQPTQWHQWPMYLPSPQIQGKVGFSPTQSRWGNGSEYPCEGGGSPTAVVEGGAEMSRGALVGGWGFGRFRSQRRRQRVKETWRSQWRDCHPARPGMYKTM